MPSVVGRPWDPDVIAPRRSFKRVVSNAELLNLFSVAVTVVPAVPGTFFVPRFLHMVKDAGTAYTLNASTQLGLFWTNVAGTQAATIAPAGFMDQTGALNAYIDAPASVASRYSAFSPALMTAIIGAPLVIANTVANFTVGTGNLTVFGVFECWPAFIAYT